MGKQLVPRHILVILNPMQIYEISAILTKLGFLATFLTNTLFIVLTLCYSRRVTGAFRNLLVAFSVICITFSAVEIIVQPYIHNFNGGAVYFSLAVDSYSFLPFDFQIVLTLAYACCYVAQLGFIAIQFLYRYFTIIQHPMQKSFQGLYQVIWVLYFFAVGGVYGLLLYYLLPIDDYTDDYMRVEMEAVYSRNLLGIPRSMEIPYDGNGRIRWNVVAYFCSGFFVINSQYLIIIFCAVKMRKSINTKLATLSARNQRLEKQFFKALAVQIILPTFLITIPIGLAMFLPFLDLKFSFQSGILFFLSSLYPSLDIIATMWIVDEYKNSMRALGKSIGVDITTKVDTSSRNGMSVASEN